MPVYDPNQVEYSIVNGNVQVIQDQGRAINAYLAHPDSGGKFSAIALIHDWWGLTNFERRLANTLAQLGYYVLVPDLFNGKTAQTPKEALGLIKNLGTRSFAQVRLCLETLENHTRSNSLVAAVGFGMGGTLAFEAALRVAELEAAVAFYGFPERNWGKYMHATTPILAVYGDQEPHVPQRDIEQLKSEFAMTTKVQHELLILNGVGRGFMQVDTAALSAKPSPSRIATNHLLTFLSKHLRA